MFTRRDLLRSTMVLAVVSAGPAFAGTEESESKTTIDVKFWDNPDKPMQTDLAYGSGGDMSKANMGFKLSTDSVPAGEITFVGTNTSEDLIHEMVVAPLPPNGKPLPYDKKDQEVDEDAAGAIGEISELDPGKTARVTLHLAAGKYILFCNITGHFAGGMWSILTVT